MFLADVLPIDPAERARRMREIKPVIVDTIDTIRDTIESTKEAIEDSVAQSQLILDNAGGGQSEASLLWPIAIVALALAGCLYLAYMYRKRRAAV